MEKWKVLFEKAVEYQKQGQRQGQAMFNALYFVDEDLANEIRSTEFDCFHNNAKIGVFKDHVNYEWSTIK